MGALIREEFKNRFKSFQYAIEGWWYIMRTQPNAWLHAIVSTAVALLALWLRLGREDWIVLVLTMMIVWMAEFMNTAIEVVVDMTMPRPHPLAKIAKDVAAAAVLVGALGAVIVGVLVLGPPLWERLAG